MNNGSIMRDFDEDTSERLAWHDLQQLAEAVALSHGVPFARAARFGGAVAQFLAEDGAADVVLKILNAPSEMARIGETVEGLIEDTSLMSEALVLPDQPSPFVEAALRTLPCGVVILRSEEAWALKITPEVPSQIDRTAFVHVPSDVLATLRAKAVTQPRSGSGLMEL